MSTIEQLNAQRVTFIAAYQSYQKTGQGINKCQLDAVFFRDIWS